MTLHRVWGSTQPYAQDAPTDGTPSIRLASLFYLLAGQTWSCVGGRVYIPAVPALQSTGIRVMAWTGVHETPIEIGTTPLRTVETTTGPVADWCGVEWEPFDVVGGTTAVAIGYEFLTEVSTYIFTGRAPVGDAEIQALDGSPLFFAEYAYTGGRGRFRIGTGSVGASAAWYGADIVLDDGASPEPTPLVAGMLVGGVWREGQLYAGQNPGPVMGAVKT